MKMLIVDSNELIDLVSNCEMVLMDKNEFIKLKGMADLIEFKKKYADDNGGTVEYIRYGKPRRIKKKYNTI